MSPHSVTPSTLTTRILSGLPLRDILLEQVATVIQDLKVPVRMAVVQVGDNPASAAYIRNKLAACQKVGIHAQLMPLQEAQGEALFHTTIQKLADDDSIHAIIVQTPLPVGWNIRTALDLVPAHKDIDGLSTASAKLRHEGNPNALLPATPLGVLRLLQHAGIAPANISIAVVGRGMVVGAPLQDMLHAAQADLTAIDKDTSNPSELTRKCDVLITAAGAPGLITQEWVKPGAVVIDVGLTRVEGKLKGDVNRASIEGTAAILTPVPGGVGPLTVASIISNIADAAALQLGQPRPVWHIPAL